MNKNILFFPEICEDEFNLVGGKGFNLGRLINANFCVPDGFCVTTLAFNGFINHLSEKEVFKSLNNISIEDLNEIDRVCSEIRNIICNCSISNELRDDIKKALNNIGNNEFYSIRSSATAEDLPDMSFAGQQDTYLNINGLDNIIENIKKCWASLYTQRAVVYRKKNNLKEENVLIAVVVQKMIYSKKSGIMFTADPLTNNYNNLTIDAGFGLGEALVGGLINPDLYKVNKKDGKIIKKEINKKEIAIYPDGNGGTYKIQLEENKRNSQVLLDEEINKLVDIGCKIEKFYKFPQDIEWAIDNSKIYILQSRPITSLYPRIEGSDLYGESKVYISFNHIQVMTDTISPLGIDMLKRVFPFGQNNKLKKSLSVFEAGGRVYIDLTKVMQLQIRNIITSKLLNNVDFLMANGLQNYLSKYNIKKGLPSKSMIKAGKTYAFPLIRKTVKNYNAKIKPNSHDIVNSFISEFIMDLDKKVNTSHEIKIKIKTVEDEATKIFSKILKNIAPFIAPGIISYKKLVGLLKSIDADITLADKVVSGIKGNITTEMGLAVGNLADAVRSKQDILNILASNPKEAHNILLNLGDEEVKELINRFLERYGMRGISEIDISNPRYQDDFTPISVSILNNIKNLNLKEQQKDYEVLVKESKKSEEEILKICKEKNNTKAMKKARNYINNIRSFLAMREHGKYALMKSFNIFRKVLFEAGRELKNKGIINKIEDVAYLTLEEIYKALDLEEKKNYKKIIDKRIKVYKYYKNLMPPRVITNEGEIFTGNYSNNSIPSNALVAMPVSSGIYEGKARVILDPTKEKLERGEILITKFTDPGWTPLFVNAKGLVLEVGGLMTHGAIVAREYGIPALVGLENATKLINTGDIIRVNANSGFVEILEKI
ncbi:phosphoenolpyruvate synthase [Clostridium sp. CTA-5]